MLFGRVAALAVRRYVRGMSTTIPLEVGDIVWARTAEGLQRVEYTGRERDAVVDLTTPAQFARVARRVADRLGLPAGAVEVAPLVGRFVVVVGDVAAVIVGKEESAAFAGVFARPAVVSRGADAAVEVLTAELVAVDEASALEAKSNRQELVMPDWLYIPSEFAWGCRRCNAFSISLNEVERLGTQEAVDMALTEHEAKCSGDTPERSRLARLHEAVEAARAGVVPSEALPSEPVAAVSEVVAQPVVAQVSEPRRKRGFTGHRGPKG